MVPVICYNLYLPRLFVIAVNSKKNLFVVRMWKSLNGFDKTGFIVQVND